MVSSSDRMYFRNNLTEIALPVREAVAGRLPLCTAVTVLIWLK